MEYTTTHDCIRNVVRDAQVVGCDQLRKFFRNAPDAKHVDYYVKQLITKNVFTYVRDLNCVVNHGAPEMSHEMMQRRLLAFWIPAYFGWENVREVTALKYPSQLLFFAEDGKMYEVSVCLKESEASSVHLVSKMYQMPDVDDCCTHIALVQNEDVGKLAIKQGLDCYCLLDDNKTPRYFAAKDVE